MFTADGGSESVYESPLHWAVQFNRPEDVELLFNNGMDMDVKDVTDSTPLHFAAVLTDCEMAATLLLFGANIDSTNNKGITPLHVASVMGNDRMVTLLLTKGADINIISNTFTAIDFALDVTNNLKSSMFNNFLDLDDAEDFSDDFECLEGDSHDTCVEILQRHIVMMESVDMHLCKDLLSHLDGEDIETFKKSCREELVRIRVSKIGNSNVTFYSFLSRSVQQLVRCLKNRKIIVVLNSDSYSDNFPIFSSLISSHFHMGKYRQALVEKYAPNSCQIFRGLPYECIELIFNYISNQELVVFAGVFCRDRMCTSRT